MSPLLLIIPAAIFFLSRRKNEARRVFDDLKEKVDDLGKIKSGVYRGYTWTIQDLTYSDGNPMTAGIRWEAKSPEDTPGWYRLESGPADSEESAMSEIKAFVDNDIAAFGVFG